MPSPIGHALGGLIVGQALSVRRLALVAAMACAPDLDFLWGRHSMETHSIGAGLLAGLVVYAVTRGREPRLSLACALAWSSHVLFDWLGADDRAPLGVMALWPVTTEFYLSDVALFDAISRQYWMPHFVPHNTWAVMKEILMLAPIALALRWWADLNRQRS